MISRGNNEITGIYYGNKVVAYVYQGAKLVWQLVSSCFGAGFWRNDYPWKNTDAWRNN